MPDVARLLRGISDSTRLALVRWLVGRGPSGVRDVAREWPGVGSDRRSGVLRTLMRSGWVASASGPATSIKAVVSVPALPVQRLAELLDRLDPLGVPVPVLDEGLLLRELRILRHESTRSVLERVIERGGHVAHPRELGLEVPRVWVAWSDLHKDGWLVDGALVEGRSSQVRRLVQEFVAALEAHGEEIHERAGEATGVGGGAGRADSGGLCADRVVAASVGQPAVGGVVIGKVLGKAALVFRVAQGEATVDETGEVAELSTNAGSGQPVIGYRGRFWSVSWQELLDIAIPAIDAELAEEAT